MVAQSAIFAEAERPCVGKNLLKILWKELSIPMIRSIDTIKVGFLSLF